MSFGLEDVIFKARSESAKILKNYYQWFFEFCKINNVTKHHEDCTCTSLIRRR